MSQKSKRLVCSIIHFLNDEMNCSSMGDEAKESIEVTIQCLRMAYEVSEPDEQEASKRRKLIDIYTEANPLTAPKLLTDEEKGQAESLKQRGNEMMKQENFEEAVTFYSQAIDIDSNSAVYFCNRAAAYTGQSMFGPAISDCQKAIEIDPHYSKAFSRMGLTYSREEKYDKAVECYDKAIALDPNNEAYKTNRKLAADKAKANRPMGGGGGMGGIPGMPDLSGMMSNPMFMNMAQEAMNNPNMRQMAMNMMSSMMGGAPPGGANDGTVPEPSASGGEAPGLDQILQLGQQFAQQVSQENPELIEQLRNQTNNSDQPPST